MNRLLTAATAAASIGLAACTPTQLGTGTGAAIGAIAVAALGGNAQQIAIGAAVGGAGGYVVSRVVQAAGHPPGVCQAYASNGQPIYVTANGNFVTYPTPYPLLVQC
jgi:hypothetical protein